MYPVWKQNLVQKLLVPYSFPYEFGKLFKVYSCVWGPHWIKCLKFSSALSGLDHRLPGLWAAFLDKSKHNMPAQQNVIICLEILT